MFEGEKLKKGVSKWSGHTPGSGISTICDIIDGWELESIDS